MNLTVIAGLATALAAGVGAASSVGLLNGANPWVGGAIAALTAFSAAIHGKNIAGGAA